MDIRTWLTQTTGLLTAADIPTARLDALVLLEDTTGKDRSWLLAHPEHLLSDMQQSQLGQHIERRSSHLPLAYIRHQSEFYGRTFWVDEAVLVPRPESESMIELWKTYFDQNSSLTHLADIGTGSGCLAVTAALETPGVRVYATDISAEALAVARKNAQNRHTPVAYHKGNLLEPVAALLQNTSYALLCNLPYVPKEYPVNAAAKHEPSIALFAGDDGLDLYRQLFEQIVDAVTPPQAIITESLLPQHTVLATLAASYQYHLLETDGLAQIFTHV